MTISTRLSIAVVAFVLVLTCGASLAKADAITTADGWTEFQVYQALGSYDLEGGFTFTGPETVTVTDAYVPGDEYAVYDNGVLLGDTSSVSNSSFAASTYYCTDPATCDADSHFSSGSFNVGSGSNSITIKIIQDAYGYSGDEIAHGFLEITPVPEPSSLGLLAAGLLGLFVVSKRKLLA